MAMFEYLNFWHLRLKPSVYGNIDADSVLLIDNCVKQDSGLTCLPVTDNKFSLSPANRDQPVNGLDSGGPALRAVSTTLGALPSMGGTVVWVPCHLWSAECVNDPPDIASPTGIELYFLSFYSVAFFNH
jgi:hypothetical protein